MQMPDLRCQMSVKKISRKSQSDSDSIKSGSYVKHFPHPRWVRTKVGVKINFPLFLPLSLTLSHKGREKLRFNIFVRKVKKEIKNFRNCFI
jgi:hypothetical protein